MNLKVANMVSIEWYVEIGFGIQYSGYNAKSMADIFSYIFPSLFN